MTPEEHIAAVVDGDVSEQTLEWLQSAFIDCIRGGPPLEEYLGVRTLRSAFGHNARDNALRKGAAIAGNIQAFMDYYHLHKVGGRVPERFSDVLAQLDKLESLGFLVPESARQLRRIGGDVQPRLELVG